MPEHPLPQVSNVEKQPGWTFAVLQLTSMEHLDEASALLAGQTVDGQRAVKLRKGVAVPGQEAAAAAPGALRLTAWI